jgi:hypothetical protein
MFFPFARGLATNVSCIFCICRKNKSVISSNEASSGVCDHALVPVNPALSEVSSSVASNALVPVDSTPISGTRTKEQDMIDLLSLTLYSPPEASQDSSTQSQNGTQQSPVSNGAEVPPNHQPAAVDGVNYSSNNQSYPTSQGYVPYNNYVAPWAQTGPSTQAGAYPTQPPQYASSYPAPPWTMSAPANSINPFQPAAYQMLNPPVASVAHAATYPALPVICHFYATCIISNPQSDADVQPLSFSNKQWSKYIIRCSNECESTAKRKFSCGTKTILHARQFIW